MKKLLVSLMSVTLVAFPAMTAVSCSKAATDQINLTFKDGVTVQKYTWDKDATKYKDNGTTSDSKDILSTLNGNGLTTTPYGTLVSNVMNLLNYNVVTKSDLTEEYKVFQGKDTNTSVVGQWTNASNEGTKTEFYKHLDDSGTHISSLKGLLELREFGDANADVASTWTNSIKTDYDMVKAWNANTVNNIKKVVDSTSNYSYKSIQLTSDIAKTSSNFAAFQQDTSITPSDSGTDITLDKQTDTVVGNIVKSDTHPDYNFGTNFSIDPFGASVLGTEGLPDISSVKPTIVYSSKKLKNDNKYINVATDASEFTYNFTKDWISSQSHYYYYMGGASDLGLKLTFGVGSTQISMDVTLSGLQKIFLPYVNSYTPANSSLKDDSKTKYSYVGWVFAGYQFSSAYDSNSTATYKDISVNINSLDIK